MYYRADIFKNEDGTFKIENLSIIQPESIIIGLMRTSYGNKNSVRIITNRKASEDIVVYPSGVISIKYNKK